MVECSAAQGGLLARLRDPRDAEAWQEFVAAYGPVVYGLGRRHGMQDADAADLTQDVLRTVVRRAPRFAYDPRRGTFRGWLLTVARNLVRRWAQARRRQSRYGGTAGAAEVLEGVAAPAEESPWEEEYRRRLFEWAAARVRAEVRPATWQAFWQTAVEQRDAGAVGTSLGLSVGAVYIARCRVLARLKEQVRRREGA
jgi:RNA polymerase sigma-70 factor (ECF subfamily)